MQSGTRDRSSNITYYLYAYLDCYVALCMSASYCHIFKLNMQLKLNFNFKLKLTIISSLPARLMKSELKRKGCGVIINWGPIF